MADNAFQVAAWQATIVGTMLSAVTLGLGVWRQRREDKRKRAEAGYNLTDEMFTDEGVIELLYALDATSLPGQHQNQRAAQLAADCEAYFGRGEELPDDRPQALWSRFDDMSFYLDRMEHAIQSDITDFCSVEMPVGYYVRELAAYRARLLSYVENVGYRRVPQFLARFESWRTARSGALPNAALKTV